MPLSQPLVRAVARSMIVLLGWQTLAGPLAANPVADPVAPAGRKPIVDAAPNGVKLVHIAPANGVRVSHNLFTAFSVPAAGVILNNRAGAGASQLGGTVGGNPQLGSTAAALIVNEVTTANVSNLLGAIEVAGAAADVVVANPWGLTCDGCGFVNTGRATLTTARPGWGSDWRLATLVVEEGNLHIGARGVNAAGLRELDLLARSITVADGAVVQADNVYAIGGRAMLDFPTLAATPLGEVGGKPAHAIQIPYAATINANQIYLVATEQGVGVRNAGSLNARSGGLQIDASGQLLLDSGRLRADGGAITLGGGSIAQTGGSTESTTGLVLAQAAQGLVLNGVSFKGGDVMLSAGADAAVTSTQLEATGDVRVSAGGHLQIDAGRTQAGGDLLLSAGRDLKIGPTVSTASTPVSGGTTTRTVYLAPEFRAGRDVALQAPGGIVNLDGAGFDAGGQIAIVGQSIGLIGPKDYEKTSTTAGGKTTVTELETLTPGSLRASLDISMVATGTADPAADPNGDRGHILLTGAKVDSDAGQVSLLAQRDIDIANDVVSSSYFQEYWQKRRRLLYTKTTHVITSSVDQAIKPSEVGGKSVSVAAGRDLNLVASSVVADGAIGLHADNDLSLLSTGEVHQAYNLKSVKKSGVFGSGGFGITIGSNRRTEISDMVSTQQIGATVGSQFGDIAATAGNQYLQLSSEIVAGTGDVSIAAREVAIQTNNNTRSLINSVRQTQSGITLTAGHPLITAAQTTIDMAKAVERTENPRLKALGVLTAGMSVWQAYKDLNKTKSTTPADWISKDNWTFNVTLGTSNYAYDSVYKESLPQESQILAGRNLSIVATGSGAAQQGDISIIGSGLSASGDVTLKAANDLNLVAATAKTSEQTRTRSSSGSIGLQLNASGTPIGATLAASKSRGFTNGWGTTYFPVEVAAGGTLSFDSWRDTNASGATLDGTRVLGTVGSGGAGNLVLASPQDQSHFVAKESSHGFSLTVSATPTLGLSLSNLRLLADWQSAREQTSIRAGSGGFDLNVNGTTYLRGAAITSTAPSSANRLTTQTLLHETVANRDNASGVASSASLNLNYTKQDGQGALAGSAFGYAQIDRANLSSTAAALAPATLNVTRGDLQANIANVWRSRERTPVANDLALQQTKLNNLLNSEPPKYSGTGIQGTGPSPLAEGWSEGEAGLEGAQTPTPEWNDWNYQVTLARTAITQLTATLSTIDTKVYGQPGNLSRTPNTSHQPLAPALDGKRATEELRSGVAITAAFGKAAFREAGRYADKKLDEELKKCNQVPKDCAGFDAWKEGGKARMALHAVIGALSYGTAGAVGAAANQMATPAIEGALIAAGLATRDAATGAVIYTPLGDLVRTAAGSAIGYAVGAAPGLSTAATADANNRQLHPEEARYIKARAKAWIALRGGSISEAQAELELTRGALYDNDLKWQQSLEKWTPEQIATYKQAADYLRNEAAHDGFMFSNLDGVMQAGFTSTPQQRANGQYMLALALSDPSTRALYSNRAAIALSLGQSAKFSAQGLAGLWVGIPSGVAEQLKSYAGTAQALSDPQTYQRLADAVRTAIKQDLSYTIGQIFNGALTQTQSAAYGTWLNWMQADSDALGQTAGRVLGAALVDAAAASVGIAVIKKAGMVGSGLSDVQVALLQRIDEAKPRHNQNVAISNAASPTTPRVFNGIEIHPGILVEPDAGWDYSPKVIHSQSDNTYWSHWTGHQAEIRLANEIASRGDVVLKWGGNVVGHGADVISVNPATGAVTLWDSKYRTASTGIGPSETFTKADSLNLAIDDALSRVRSSMQLSPSIQSIAVRNLTDRNFFANTVGMGNVNNSVPLRICGLPPC